MLLSTLASDPPRQLNVLGHDGDPLGVNGTQVGVLEQTHQVSLASLLKSHHGRTLETQVGLEVLRDFSHKSLEGQLPDQQLGTLLVTPNFSQRHRTGSIPVRLFDSTGGRSTFSGRLGGQLLSGCFSTRRLSGSLLGTSHCNINTILKMNGGKHKFR